MTLVLRPAQVAALVALGRLRGSPRFVMIGAAALNHHVRLARSTADIDLAIVMDQTTMARSLSAIGWTRESKAEHRWRVDGVLVDVLPVTPELIAKGAVSFDGGDSEMSLVGFDLALRHTVRIGLPQSLVTVEVAQLPVLLVLKMRAWLDRPFERAHDLGDLATVLHHALGPDDDRRWTPPLVGTDYDHQSATFAGWEVGKIADGTHLDHVQTFLEATSNPESTGFAQMLREANYGGGDPASRLEGHLEAFSRGLELGGRNRRWWATHRRHIGRLFPGRR